MIYDNNSGVDWKGDWNRVSFANEDTEGMQTRQDIKKQQKTISQFKRFSTSNGNEDRMDRGNILKMLSSPYGSN